MLLFDDRSAASAAGIAGAEGGVAGLAPPPADAPSAAPALAAAPRLANGGGGVRLLGWCGLLAVVVRVLHAMGRGPLAAPPLRAPGAWHAWSADREPATAAIALIRVGALALAWYLVAATAVGVVVRLTRVRPLIALADLATVAPLRRLLHASLGAGLLVAVWAGPATAATVRPAEAPVLEWLDDGHPPPPPDAPSNDTPDAGADLSAPVQPDPSAAPTPEASTPTSTDGPAPAPPPEPAANAPPTDAAEAPPASADTAHAPPASEPAHTPPAPDPAPPNPAPPPQPAPTTAATTWTVQRGESFWRIAKAELTKANGRPPTDREIVPYWHRVIEANRDRLAHRGNPDLLFVGQTLTVPAP